MVAARLEELRAEIAGLIDRLGPGRSSLIPILQDIKRRRREVDPETMQVVAEMLDIHPVEVYSVASFYAFLHGAPQGVHVIRLCNTLACDFAGKDAVADALREQVGVEFGETTADGQITLEWASCIGMCDQGPALLLDDEVHTRVTPADVAALVAACRDGEGRAEA